LFIAVWVIGHGVVYGQMTAIGMVCSLISEEAEAFLHIHIQEAVHFTVILYGIGRGDDAVNGQHDTLKLGIIKMAQQ
jgi:hypothetical protein